MSKKEKPTEDPLDALQKSVDKARKKMLRQKYDDAVKAGAKTFGGHLGTCDALFGDPYCTCGKPSDWKPTL